MAPFKMALQAYEEMPIVSGSLIADRITIHGSDLVHNEGRKLGNYIALFLACENVAERKEVIERLRCHKLKSVVENEDSQKLIEVTDAFDVRWVLGLND